MGEMLGSLALVGLHTDPPWRCTGSGFRDRAHPGVKFSLHWES